MPNKRKGRRAQRGKGWLSDAWKKAKDTVVDTAKAIHKTAKDRKVISGALKDMFGKDHWATQQAKKAGYGRRRRRAPQAGKGIFGDVGGWLGSRAGDALGGVLGMGRQVGSGGYPRVYGGIVAPNRDIMY